VSALRELAIAVREGRGVPLAWAVANGAEGDALAAAWRETDDDWSMVQLLARVDLPLAQRLVEELNEMARRPDHRCLLRNCRTCADHVRAARPTLTLPELLADLRGAQ
jgi:hypothetical protein